MLIILYILFSTNILLKGLPSDQLVAGQIVALRGIPSTKVVQQMVNMLIEGDNEYEQASKLLIHLSQFTVSLFYLLKLLFYF